MRNEAINPLGITKDDLTKYYIDQNLSINKEISASKSEDEVF